MRILVAGGFDADEEGAEDCQAFCRALGAQLVKQGHTVLGGCQTLLDATVASAVAEQVRAEDGDDESVHARLISYVNQGAKPSHDHGCILKSKLASWDMTGDDVYVPEPIQMADAVIIVRGWDGTYRAANWARYDSKPLLPIAAFAGAAERVFEKERQDFARKYARNVSQEEYDILSQQTSDWTGLARRVVDLTEKITASRSVFVIMSFSDNPELEDAYDSIKEVCDSLDFVALRVDESNTEDRIIPKIEEGIRECAFVIADVTEERPNVYYELGLADGFGKRKIVSAREGTKVHFDLFDVPILRWKNQKQLKEGLRARLREFAADSAGAVS